MLIPWKAANGQPTDHGTAGNPRPAHSGPAPPLPASTASHPADDHVRRSRPGRASRLEVRPGPQPHRTRPDALPDRPHLVSRQSRSPCRGGPATQTLLAVRRASVPGPALAVPPRSPVCAPASRRQRPRPTPRCRPIACRFRATQGKSGSRPQLIRKYIRISSNATQTTGKVVR